MSWPYPGDSPVVRARRVAHAYRQRLDHADPHACATLDDLVQRLGETWAVPRIIHVDPEDWLNATDAADYAAVTPDEIWRLRRTGRLPGRRTRGHWEFQVRDLMALGADIHTRGKRGQETTP